MIYFIVRYLALILLAIDLWSEFLRVAANPSQGSYFGSQLNSTPHLPQNPVVGFLYQLPVRTLNSDFSNPSNLITGLTTILLVFSEGNFLFKCLQELYLITNYLLVQSYTHGSNVGDLSSRSKSWLRVHDCDAPFLGLLLLR